MLGFNAGSYAVSAVMKRLREQIAEEEPLSKRINNLHLDGSAPLLPCSSANLAPPLTSHNLPVNGTLLENNINCLQERLHGNAAIVSLPNIASNSMLNGVSHSHNGIERIRNDLIARREMPESLNVIYPNINPTNNDSYFGFNKVLHDLHIERLKRLGKIAL